MPEEERNLQERLRQAQRLVESTETADTPIAAFSDKIRFFASVSLIGLYSLVLLGALAIFAAQGYFCETATQPKCGWDKAAENALELIKVGMMPVIAVVIAFYFVRNNK